MCVSLSSLRQQGLDQFQLGLGLLVEVVVDLVNFSFVILGNPSQDIVLEILFLLLFDNPTVMFFLFTRSVLDLKQLVSGKQRMVI